LPAILVVAYQVLADRLALPMEAVGQSLGGVEIANGDREPARATALRGLADAGDMTGIGGSHRRERRRRVYPTASGAAGGHP
jgi:hypothetical protein